MFAKVRSWGLGTARAVAPRGSVDLQPAGGPARLGPGAACGLPAPSSRQGAQLAELRAAKSGSFMVQERFPLSKFHGDVRRTPGT